MRIFHVIANARWTGPADPVVSLAAGLKIRGHTIHLACRPNGTLVSNAAARGISPITHLNLGVSSNPIKYFEDIHKIQSLLLLLKIDILHLHGSHEHTLGALAARLCSRRVQVVRTHHKAGSIRSDPFHRYLYANLTDLNVVVSRMAEKVALDKGAVRADMLRVVSGGVDITRFRKGKSNKETRFAHGLKEDQQVLALVSHVRANRGHMTALESWQIISPEYPDARLVFLGESDKSYRKFLVEEVRRRGLEESVRFILDESFDWVQLLDMVDVIMVLAVGSEGSSRAILEAMALEKAVIGAEVGAIPDIVESETSGLLVPPDNPHSLAGAMRRILTDWEGREKFGKAARHRIENSFTNELRAERMEELYLEFMGNKK